MGFLNELVSEVKCSITIRRRHAGYSRLQIRDGSVANIPIRSVEVVFSLQGYLWLLVQLSK